MIHLTGEVLGSQQLDRALSRIEASATDFTKVFEELGDEFRDIEDERFAGQGFGEWPPLSLAYAARKRAQYGDKPILRASDKLYQSLVVKGAEGNVTRITPTQAEFGTSIFYAIYHQTGTSRMPARPVILLREEDKQRLVRTVQRYMIATGQEAGFQLLPG